MQRKGVVLAATVGFLLVAAQSSVNAQPSGAICEFIGTAKVRPGLGLEPSSQSFRFDGDIPSCPTASLAIPGAPAPIDCSGAKLVAVGNLSPSACFGDQHTGVYAITGGDDPVCNVGAVSDCPQNGVCKNGAGEFPCTAGEKCPVNDSVALNGICVGAVCAGRDTTSGNEIGGQAIPPPATSRGYAIVFSDPSDAAVIEQCPTPPAENVVIFQGAIAFDETLFGIPE